MNEPHGADIGVGMSNCFRSIDAGFAEKLQEDDHSPVKKVSAPDLAALMELASEEFDRD